MKLLKKVKGFTLIELMIVIAIIGICVAIGTSSFMAYKRKQEELKLKEVPLTTEQVLPKAEPKESGDLKKL